MRTPRVAILVLFFAASLFLFCRSVSSFRRSGPSVATTSATTTTATTSSTEKSAFRSFFSFTGAFTLFPPNAAISLTDDNSTFFPARPAAFGPPLPGNGLSGQLWIGSGFADDNLQDGESEGELGCSDVPGWEDGKATLALKMSEKVVGKAGTVSPAGKVGHAKKGGRSGVPAVDRSAEAQERAQAQPDDPAPVDDGTDDYLHQGYQQTKRTHRTKSHGSGTSHADIQSIQEAAEITGKVVLLSRGGCGFLEKVKWAQRRGAIAVIVGDNQKGGPLIQMFARGNVDNVSIPSIFTSRTTAHLLSSLVQPGSFIEDILDENGNPVLKVQQSDKGRKKNKKAKQTTTTTAAAAAKATAKPKSVNPVTTDADGSSSSEKSSSKSNSQDGGWLWRLFHWGSGSGSASDQSRPPSSGRLDWVMLDDWSDEKDRVIKSSLDKVSRNSDSDASPPVKEKSSGDNFQIGVEDWRDPDLVGSPSTGSGQGSNSNDADKSTDGQSRAGEPNAATKQAGKMAGSGTSKDVSGLKGGINTPGSGEYVPGTEKSDSGSSGSQGGLISKIFGDDDDDDTDFTRDAAPGPVITQTPDHPRNGDDGGDGVHHEGLWVTITPTSSASPFFDTLLVLVISPLITLTVVYALLILRAKIRRRRWRAPKSVVDRLPVRTYHTVAPSPIPSPRQPSPNSSSPTTPLLQGSSRSPRPRPRSRTTTGVPEPADMLLRVDSALELPRSPSRAEHEKGPQHISSEWKKYMGRQVECVVCLEEYVDGVSRVMSLPCGHEFHAECM